MSNRFLLFIGVVFVGAFVIPAVFILSCHPDQFPSDTAAEPDSTSITVPVPAEEPPFDPCNNATKFSVQLCIDDVQDLMWYGLWDECFNLGCETSWTPGHGLICFRCTYPICEEGFQWKSVGHLCSIPEYTFTVDVNYENQGAFWEACITFPPDECLAETYPNCYDFLIYAANCPY